MCYETYVVLHLIFWYNGCDKEYKMFTCRTCCWSAESTEAELLAVAWTNIVIVY